MMYRISKAGWIVVLFSLLSLSAPFIANQYPLFALVKGHAVFPFVQIWKYDSLVQHHKPDFLIRALVPYSPGVSDLDNADMQSPFAEQWMRDDSGNRVAADFYHRHHLGTDVRGADVLAGILHGSGLSLLIAGISALFALVIGSVAGLLAAWNQERRISLFSLASFCTVFVLFYGLWRSNPGSDFRFMLLMLLIVLLVSGYKLLSLSAVNRFLLPVNLDDVVMTLIQSFSLVPRLVFMLAGMVVLPSSSASIVLVMILTSWFEFARVVRSEVRRIRGEAYLESARISGARLLRIFFRHIGPNIWPALSVSFIFAFANNVLFESVLSFLGLGVPPGQVTLGSLLANGRSYPEAWWLVVFPGLWLTVFLSALFRLAKINREKN
jgi:peptide/nickel transport system permease protein